MSHTGTLLFGFFTSSPEDMFIAFIERGKKSEKEKHRLVAPNVP